MVGQVKQAQHLKYFNYRVVLVPKPYQTVTIQCRSVA